ncbi:NAD(P)-dependent oxidoreductase [Roseomonas alkaliterrae]|uniref:3-hydroxyisobutyrate dehydrogenase n=1 Tax=Neoroseomonas alkaliterrae TaxID=1452450 RepID=A0A840XN23_9PROT|nr:NAD(P)-dependent oxidoreductase [Neoroseomonas alkaliterrae]MBB5689985.1 3-hydroxyisobutyrate dehydrogenase [Neoroseomonas alkaliterrae]MBR0675537.1 NAD(P)-dependent oxidoreductase [Neoroseomonas alkaliterrae]
MSAPIKRVAFLGIGNMGWPMAANLVKAGFTVTVADVVPGRAEAFAAETGAKAAATPAEAAAGAECVVTIVPTSKQVAEAMEAIAPSLAPGMLVIDMTSGQPGRTREIASALAARGVAMVDCPVSGGVPRARTGQLAIMAGGADADLDRAEPVLKAMGTSIHRCGPIGAGQAMKALNNLVSAGGYLIGIEALLIGQRFGLDPAKMVDVLNASTGMNNSTQKKFKEYVLSRRFDAGFGLDLMVKDLSIALEVGRETATPTPFAALCREMWAAAAAMLGPGADHTAVAKLSEQISGTVLGGNVET